MCVNLKVENEENTRFYFSVFYVFKVIISSHREFEAYFMSRFSSHVFRIQTFPCLQTNIFLSSLHGFYVHGMAIEYEPDAPRFSRRSMKWKVWGSSKNSTNAIKFSPFPINSYTKFQLVL